METQKLQPHEKPLYQKTFTKHKDMGCATKFAHEQAMLAVKLWNEVSAFDVAPKAESDKPGIDLEAAWNFLCETLQRCATGSSDWRDMVAAAMIDYTNGGESIETFKTDIGLIFHDPTD